jgi:hypothetical protein
VIHLSGVGEPEVVTQRLLDAVVSRIGAAG